MKLEQQPKFQPITITLATTEEAEVFWEMTREVGMRGSQPVKAMAIEVSNWFTQKAQL